MTDKYEIKNLVDEYDCDDCGYSFASGYVILKNGEVLIDKTPSAHCYSGTGYDNDNPYKDILEHLSISVKEYDPEAVHEE